MSTAAPTTHRICTACKHCLPAQGDLSNSRCVLLPLPFNVVTGEQKFQFCEIARLHGKCGPDGALWERRAGE